MVILNLSVSQATRLFCMGLTSFTQNTVNTRCLQILVIYQS
jgi:hypothetical protein